MEDKKKKYLSTSKEFGKALKAALSKTSQWVHHYADETPAESSERSTINEVRKSRGLEALPTGGADSFFYNAVYDPVIFKVSEVEQEPGTPVTGTIHDEEYHRIDGDLVSTRRGGEKMSIGWRGMRTKDILTHKDIVSEDYISLPLDYGSSKKDKVKPVQVWAAFLNYLDLSCGWEVFRVEGAVPRITATTKRNIEKGWLEAPELAPEKEKGLSSGLGFFVGEYLERFVELPCWHTLHLDELMTNLVFFVFRPKIEVGLLCVGLTLKTFSFDSLTEFGILTTLQIS